MRQAANCRAISLLRLYLFFGCRTVVISFVQLIARPSVRPCKEVFVSSVAGTNGASHVSERRLRQVQSGYLSPCQVRAAHLYFRPWTVTNPRATSKRRMPSYGPTVKGKLRASLRAIICGRLCTTVLSPIIHGHIRSGPAFKRRDHRVHVQQGKDVRRRT